MSVTYFSSLFCEDRSPAVDPPFDSFSNIRNDWAVLGSPSTWFGIFTVNPGTYTDWFINFDGRLCFDCCGGDFNEDDTVDFNDLQVLLSAWDTSDAGDANYDGMTDFADLLIVTSNWARVPTELYRKLSGIPLSKHAGSEPMGRVRPTWTCCWT